VSVPAYRVTVTDLHDADQKMKRGLLPLLTALNKCLSLLVTTVNAIVLPTPKSASFNSDASGNASVPVKLDVTPKEVWLTALSPPPTAAYLFAWSPDSSGATLSFVGLTASIPYTFTVRYF